MSVSNEQLQTIMQRSELRERRARRLALWLAVIPVIIGLLFLAFTVWSTNRVQEELVTKEEELHTAEVVLQETIIRYQTVDLQLSEAAQKVAAAEQIADAAEQSAAVAEQTAAAAQAEVESSRAEMAQLSARLEQSDAALAQVEGEASALRTELTVRDDQYNRLQTQVLLASEFQTVRDYANWQSWLAESLPYFARLYANNPQAGALIARMLGVLDMLYRESPPYNPQGSTLQEGFTSASFALHVLREIGRVPPQRSPILEQSELREYLLANGMRPRPDNRPQPGDVVLYKDGFTMFYFPDPQQRPFVIGMTPGGVKLLPPDFTEIVEVIGVVE